MMKMFKTASRASSHDPMGDSGSGPPSRRSSQGLLTGLEESRSTLGEGFYVLKSRNEPLGLVTEPGATRLCVMVLKTLQGSPCDRAGVEAGTLVQVGELRIGVKEDLVESISKIRAASQLKFPMVVDTAVGRKTFRINLTSATEPLGMEFVVVQYDPAVISHIATGSPAARAGLRVGQNVYAVDMALARHQDEVEGRLNLAEQRGGDCSIAAGPGDGVVETPPALYRDAHATPGSDTLLTTSLATSPRRPRTPTTNAPRRRGSARSAKQSDTAEAEQSGMSCIRLETSYTDMAPLANSSFPPPPPAGIGSGISAGKPSTPGNDRLGSQTQGVRTPSNKGPPRRRKSGSRASDGGDASPLASPTDSPAGVRLRPAPVSSGRVVEFTDTDGDKVRLGDTGSGISLSVNSTQLGVLHTLRYDAVSGQVTDAIGMCTLPLEGRLRLEKELVALAEVAGVSHDIPSSEGERIAVVLFSAEEPLGLSFNLFDNGAIMITGAEPGSPAGRAALPSGHLVKIDDTPVVGSASLKEAVARVRELARGGRPSFTVTVRRELNRAATDTQIQPPLIAVEGDIGPSVTHSFGTDQARLPSVTQSFGTDQARLTPGDRCITPASGNDSARSVSSDGGEVEGGKKKKKRIVIVKKKRRGSKTVEGAEGAEGGQEPALPKADTG
eukprot:Hpha_TRINITY_DN162_c0_g1::TRINITY_DN162_c0_g1_i1::g.82309::m.82309